MGSKKIVDADTNPKDEAQTPGAPGVPEVSQSITGSEIAEHQR